MGGKTEKCEVMGICTRKRQGKRSPGVKAAGEKIPWHIIEGHFGAKLLIDKSTNLPGRR